LLSSTSEVRILEREALSAVLAPRWWRREDDRSLEAAPTGPLLGIDSGTIGDSHVAMDAVVPTGSPRAASYSTA